MSALAQKVGGAPSRSTNRVYTISLLLPLHHRSCSSKAGVLIGTLPTEAHGVSGVLYVHDDVTLSIEQFYYDGYAPGEPIFFHMPVGKVKRFSIAFRGRPLRPAAAYPYFYSKGNVPNNAGGGIKM